MTSLCSIGPVTGATRRLVFAVAVVVSACTTPAERIDRTAAAAGFSKQTISGSRFDHLVMTRNMAGLQDKRIHVYIEGDGSPWIANRWISEDPTPRQPVALELMQIDQGPVVYLGRPCYFGMQRNCSQELWTSGRYSAPVVQAMSDALNALLDETGFTGSMVIIGYSGGGTLAMLLASKVSGIDTLITVAANLDVERWTRHHGYSALKTSLNPASQPPLPEHITQIHLVGSSDKNVPPQIVENAVSRQPNATLLRYPDYTHHCCWTEAWPEILDTVRRD